MLHLGRGILWLDVCHCLTVCLLEGCTTRRKCFVRDSLLVGLHIHDHRRIRRLLFGLGRFDWQRRFHFPTHLFGRFHLIVSVSVKVLGCLQHCYSTSAKRVCGYATLPKGIVEGDVHQPKRRKFADGRSIIILIHLALQPADLLARCRSSRPFSREI